MQFNEIIQAISTVGFPILMCIYVYYQDNLKIDKLNDTINKNTETLKELSTLINHLIDKKEEK